MVVSLELELELLVSEELDGLVELGVELEELELGEVLDELELGDVLESELLRLEPLVPSSRPVGIIVWRRLWAFCRC